MANIKCCAMATKGDKIILKNRTDNSVLTKEPINWSLILDKKQWDQTLNGLILYIEIDEEKLKELNGEIS